MTDIITTIGQSLSKKDWSLYPFIPPAFSLFLSLLLMPMYGNLIGRHLQSYLEAHEIGHLFEFINAISKDRALQIAYLTGVPSFLASFIATLRSGHPYILAAGALVIFLVGLILFLQVFLRSPGFHATTRFPEKRRPTWLYKRNWTYFEVYSKALTLFNVLLIILIVFALPKK